MAGQGFTLLRHGPALAPFALADQVRDFANLLKALKIDQPVHLVSLSYGAAVGMSFAVLYPEKVARIVAIEGLGITPQLIGKQVRCLSCRTVFRIPQE